MSEPTNNGGEVITVQAAADMKGVVRQTVYKAMERGAISFVEWHGIKRPLLASVEAWEPGTGHTKDGGTIQRAVIRRGGGRPPGSKDKNPGGRGKNKL